MKKLAIIGIFIFSAIYSFATEAQTNTNNTVINCRFSLAEHDNLE